jgi:hypothetical protein
MAEATPEAILIAAGFHIFTAPVNTPIPEDIDEPLDGAFVDVGFTTDDGAVFTHTPTVNPIPMHQSFQPVRYVVASVEDTLSFVLGQWDVDTIPLAFGGGEWSVTENGWRFTPAEPGTIDERVVVAEAQDGDIKWRIVMPRVSQQGASSTTLTKSGAAGLAVTLGAMAVGDGEAAWSLLTDSEFAAAGS